MSTAITPANAASLLSEEIAKTAEMFDKLADTYYDKN